MEKLFVCIPCQVKHVPLLERCLMRMTKQSRLPDGVVVSMSSVTKNPQQRSKFPFPVTWLVTKDTLNASQNRNRAAAEAIRQGATLLSFFDADDIMHGDRLKILEGHFRDPSVDAIVHNMNVCLDMNPRRPLTPHFWPKKHFQKGCFDFEKDPLRPTVAANAIDPTIEKQGCQAAGHASVRPAVFQALGGYPEEIVLGEDNAFLTALVKQGFCLGQAADVLCYYMRPYGRK